MYAKFKSNKNQLKKKDLPIQNNNIFTVTTIFQNGITHLMLLNFYTATLYLPFIQEITKYLCQGGTTTQLIVRQGEIIQMKIPLRLENCSVTSRDVTE